MLQAVKLVVAPLAWRLLRGAVRVAEFRPAADDPAPPFIFACLHRDILPAIIHVRPARPSLLVSPSPDGDILVRTLGRRSYCFVRGATGEDGQRAFVALRRELEQGRSIGVAVDGPKGPYGVINEGVLQLSRLGGVPILPLRAEVPRRTVLRTWDRTVVPHLFSRVIMHRGPLLSLPRDAGEAELAAVRDALFQFLTAGEGADAGA